MSIITPEMLARAKKYLDANFRWLETHHVEALLKEVLVEDDTPAGEPRWRAVLTYRYETGPRVREVFIEEIEDLHDIIEKGPDWNCLIYTIILPHNQGKRITVEASQCQ